MARLIWSSAFVDEMEEICNHIGRDSPQYAAILCHKIFDLVESLPAHPQMSAIVAEFQRDDIREVYLYNYRIIFRLRGNDVELVTIIHGSRLLPPTSEDLLGAAGES
ncbi:MAG: type II toxin-antitoxin system RelE/ParE family toxin [Pirellulaceae bacterium]